MIQQQAITVNTTTGAWSASVSGLKTGQSYTFNVQCTQTSGMFMQNVVTKAADQTAP